MEAMISLRNVADELEALMEGCRAYLNRHTGEVYMVADDELRLAETDLDPDGLSGWEQEAVAKAREVLESSDWLVLPTKFDMHEWAMMAGFSRSVSDAALRDELLSAIRGRGRFGTSGTQSVGAGSRKPGTRTSGKRMSGSWPTGS